MNGKSKMLRKDGTDWKLIYRLSGADRPMKKKSLKKGAGSASNLSYVDKNVIPTLAAKT